MAKYGHNLTIVRILGLLGKRAVERRLYWMRHGPTETTDAQEGKDGTKSPAPMQNQNVRLSGTARELVHAKFEGWERLARLFSMVLDNRNPDIKIPEYDNDDDILSDFVAGVRELIKMQSQMPPGTILDENEIKRRLGEEFGIPDWFGQIVAEVQGNIWNTVDIPQSMLATWMNLGVENIITSPADRCVETIDIFLFYENRLSTFVDSFFGDVLPHYKHDRDKRRTVWDDIYEFNLLSNNHSFGGETDAIAKRVPYKQAYFARENPETPDGTGAESFSHFIDRVRNFIARLERTNIEELDNNSLVCGHEQFFNAARILIAYQPAASVLFQKAITPLVAQLEMALEQNKPEWVRQALEKSEDPLAKEILENINSLEVKGVSLNAILDDAVARKSAPRLMYVLHKAYDAVFKKQLMIMFKEVAVVGLLSDPLDPQSLQWVPTSRIKPLQVIETRLTRDGLVIVNAKDRIQPEHVALSAAKDKGVHRLVRKAMEMEGRSEMQIRAFDFFVDLSHQEHEMWIKALDEAGVPEERQHGDWLTLREVLHANDPYRYKGPEGKNPVKTFEDLASIPGRSWSR